MIFQKTKHISILFIALNSAGFFAGIFFLTQHILSACAAIFLLIALNFVIYHIYVLHMYDLLEQENIKKEASLSAELSETIDKRIEELTQNCASLEKENKDLKEQTAGFIDKLSRVPMFYHCPLTSASPVNLNKFFSTYFKEHTADFHQANINASIQADYNGCKTLLSPSAITLICNNLLDNSLKFTPPGGTLLVTITKKENDVLIIWKNTGDGIRESDSEKVFDLNFGNSPAGKGTGLGLTQVSAIVHDYGGNIWVKSSRGNGFAVYLQLPFSQKGGSAA